MAGINGTSTLRKSTVLIVMVEPHVVLYKRRHSSVMVAAISSHPRQKRGGIPRYRRGRGPPSDELNFQRFGLYLDLTGSPGYLAALGSTVLEILFAYPRAELRARR